MNEADQALIDALRALGADGSRSAPARVEDRLVAAFRRRSRARVQRRWLIAGVGAIAAALALFAWTRPVPVRTGVLAARTVASGEAAVAAGSGEMTLPGDETVTNGDSVSDFMPLPGADGLAPLESAMIVRVEMPVSSLRLMGVLINDGQAGGEVQADLLLGQDGLARGVRLVD